ncbi:MAG: flagellar hook-basal body complex protein [Proteobacteria bacterium]|nr:flagellar hook-basal body complex protein [Pseudomonadota bacterium]MBU1710528.1 flagellar hook-basal body complex protein [Pseudomonadota bacterium]
MGISSSLYSSISGLNTMGNAMSVLGDNVANVNTIAFKSSRATFQDVLSQSVSTASGAAQVGRGVTLSTVDGLFAQGSFESSSTPTDMAIGGQGFFMLRGPESNEADNYTRAGEFRFDQEGHLVNPKGYFVQGWSIASNTGNRQGTIGDITIGKSTPPVATTDIEVIVNVDSRQQNETTEVRLFDAWDGRNAAAVNPTDPIDSANYEYTSAIKIYDTVGASHDVTIYFDRTTNDNEWEFLVTCDPSEDQRYLDAADQTVYAPNLRYDYADHKGAGALMYGIINFSTSGDIDRIDAFSVPPDAEVDPSLNDNRMVLGSSESYFSFPTNFTGDTINQGVTINLGARFSGSPTNLTQVVVSDLGAYSDPAATTRITSETFLSSVYDSNGNAIANGDVFTFAGFQHDGTRATTLVYTVANANTTKVQDILDQLETTFTCTASIDATGKLRITDQQGGDSGMYISSFTNTSAANPWGTQINYTTSKRKIVSTERAVQTATDTVPVISGLSTWANVYDTAGNPVVVGNTFQFAGTATDGTTIAGAAGLFDSAVAADSPNGTVQDMLDWLESTFLCEAEIDNAGRLVLTDRVADTSAVTSPLDIASIAYSGAGAPFGLAQFDILAGDTGGEDGSRQGDEVTSEFDAEALASTQYANSSTTIFQDQDGFASGFLQSVSVDTEGVITGHYSNGQVLKKAQVALATFNNLAGLFKEGGNVFRETTDSGAPITGAPGTNGLGSIAPNALEQSNVDIGTEFVKLITTQRGFQANSKIISTTDEMLADLINIKR